VSNDWTLSILRVLDFYPAERYWAKLLNSFFGEFAWLEVSFYTIVEFLSDELETRELEFVDSVCYFEDLFVIRFIAREIKL
jgi:hypothetical protein